MSPVRTHRCPTCGQPLAAFAGQVPAGLPFATTVALGELEAAVRRHRPHCPGGR